MVEVKKSRKKGKISFNRYFQKLKEGEIVAVVREISLRPRFPQRLQGRTGTIAEKRGKAYLVKINDKNKEKSYLIEPIHLRKIKTIQEVK